MANSKKSGKPFRGVCVVCETHQTVHIKGKSQICIDAHSCILRSIDASMEESAKNWEAEIREYAYASVN